MATINVPQPFILKNDVLRTLLHEGKNLTLKLWTKDNQGGRKYIHVIWDSFLELLIQTSSA